MSYNQEIHALLTGLYHLKVKSIMQQGGLPHTNTKLFIEGVQNPDVFWRLRKSCERFHILFSGIKTLINHDKSIDVLINNYQKHMKNANNMTSESVDQTLNDLSKLKEKCLMAQKKLEKEEKEKIEDEDLELDDLDLDLDDDDDLDLDDLEDSDEEDELDASEVDNLNTATNKKAAEEVPETEKVQEVPEKKRRTRAPSQSKAPAKKKARTSQEIFSKLMQTPGSQGIEPGAK